MNKYLILFKPAIWRLTIYTTSKKKAEQLAWKEFRRWTRVNKSKKNEIYSIKQLKVKQTYNIIKREIWL